MSAVLLELARAGQSGPLAVFRALEVHRPLAALLLAHAVRWPLAELFAVQMVAQPRVGSLTDRVESQQDSPVSHLPDATPQRWVFEQTTTTGASMAQDGTLNIPVHGLQQAGQREPSGERVPGERLHRIVVMLKRRQSIMTMATT